MYLYPYIFQLRAARRSAAVATRPLAKAEDKVVAPLVPSGEGVLESPSSMHPVASSRHIVTRVV